MKVLADDDLEHGLVAEAALGALPSELLYELFVEQDGRRPGPGTDQYAHTARLQILAEVAPLELLDLKVRCLPDGSGLSTLRV
ncbi:MAG: hypothetical protein AABZ30_01645 [Myxococcota bacterium]